MSAIGGSIESITLDGQNFAVAGDADTQRKIGGWENEMQANGNGTARMIKTRVPWGLTGVQVVVDDDRDDQSYLQELANRNDSFPIAITYASGAIMVGDGQITGEVQYSNNSSTASLEMAGEGVLSSQ